MELLNEGTDNPESGKCITPDDETRVYGYDAETSTESSCRPRQKTAH